MAMPMMVQPDKDKQEDDIDFEPQDGPATARGSAVQPNQSQVIKSNPATGPTRKPAANRGSSGARTPTPGGKPGSQKTRGGKTPR